MVFSSTVFLFLFLPIVLLLNFLLAKKYRNILILLSSLFFYAWGEHKLVLLMIFSICLNYLVGIGIEFFGKSKRINDGKYALWFGIICNLSILIYYKYAHFFAENLEKLHLDINAERFAEIALPIGVSFFTFQNISYIIDVYRKEVPAQRNLLHLGLYISLFPQLIAGPIVRYTDIFHEIKNRVITSYLFAEGITRFIRGLAKKVLIANAVGIIADKAFEQNPHDLSSSVAWLGIICYSLQIYFDFSGYSDMAIGLGKMLGFNFKENFNYPYIAKSIQEFWRRWHISLSTWFRDYLYIPLGGNRKGEVRTYVNLIIVFLITGLWHGASWSFIVWGLFHGAFLLLERLIPFRVKAQWNFLGHIYLLLVVIIGWVFFRADNLSLAIDYLGTMFSFKDGTANLPLLYLDNYHYFMIFLGFIFSTPIRKYIYSKLNIVTGNKTALIASYSFHLILFFLTILELSQTTFNPFIYFRF